MPDPGLITSKVRLYMESLSPTARAMLVRSLRASQAAGDLPNELILAAIDGLDIAEEPIAPAAPAAAAVPAGLPGEPWSQRLEAAFFTPLSPFLVDEVVATHQTGRIARAHLPAIWTWIRRDVVSDDYERAIAADPLDPRADVAPIARKFRRDAMARVVEVMREAGVDPKVRQKVIGHVGGEGAYRSLVDAVYVLQNEGAFANLFGQLPHNITVFDMAEPSRVADVIRASIEQVQLTLEWVAAAVLARTNNPAVLAHLACRLAASSDPRLVAGSRFGVLIDCLIGQLERYAALARARGNDPESRRRFVTDLRSYHEVTKNLALTLPTESVSAWFRRLGGVRVAMSETVARVIEAAPGLVRRALRVEAAAGEIPARFDPDAYDDAEFAVRVSIEARLAAESLAVNELVGRTRKQVETTLEVISGKLLADLKSSPVLDRRVMTDAADAAIRLAALVFGEDYAAVMRKSRDLSLQQRATG